MASNKAPGDYEGVKIDFGVFRAAGNMRSTRTRLQG